jgi:hypothetical protein
MPGRLPLLYDPSRVGSYLLHLHTLNIKYIFTCLILNIDRRAIWPHAFAV